MPLQRATSLFILILFILFSLYYHDLLFRLPSGIHEWAQSDRASLALGYYDHGMNLFKPRTLSIFSHDGITGVELPLQAYTTALLAHVFGREHIYLIFRILDMLIVGMGLISLFRFCFRYTRAFFLSALPSLFLLLSPTFVDYSCSFMPDPVAAALVITGLCSYLHFIQQPKKSLWYQSVLLLLLAAFVKTSTGLYLIGVLAHECVRLFSLYGKKHFIRKVIPVASAGLLAGLLLLVHYLHIKNLNATYDGQLFTAKSNPFSRETWDTFINSNFRDIWKKEYLIRPGYFFLLIILTAGLLSPASRLLKSFILLFPILLAGVAYVFYMFGEQFLHHDYYIVSIVFPFLAFTLLICVLKINESHFFKTKKLKADLITGLSLLPFLITAQFKVADRLSPDYTGFSDYYSYQWMTGGQDFLRRHHVGQSEQLIIIREQAPNLGLCYFDRRGYVLDESYYSMKWDTLAAFMADRTVRYAVLSASSFRYLLDLNQGGPEDYFRIVAREDDKVLLQRI